MLQLPEFMIGLIKKVKKVREKTGFLTGAGMGGGMGGSGAGVGSDDSDLFATQETGEKEDKLEKFESRMVRLQVRE